MKITLIEIEATAEDLKASRSVSDAMTMATEKITDVFMRLNDPAEELEEDETE